MATLKIGNSSVTVDDAFLTLPSDQQSAAVEEIAAAIGNQPSVMGDVAKSAGIGLAKGGIGLAGLMGDMQAAAPELGKWIDAKIGAMGPKLTPEQEAYIARYRHLGEARMPTSAEIRKPIESVTGEFYKPKTTAGEYAQTVGEFLPSAVIGPGGPMAKVASAVTAGLGSEGAGQLARKVAPEWEPYARVAGGVAGGLAPSMLSRAISPNAGRISPQRQNSVNTLEREGVEVTSGQATGNNRTMYKEAEAVSRIGDDLRVRQGEQLTAAAMRRAGENVNRATAANIDNAFTRIGQNFDDLAARNTVLADTQLGNALATVERQYMSLVPESMRKPVVADTIREIGDAFAANRGALGGEAYQSLTSRLAALARGTRDNELRDALHGIRGAFDDAMQRSIAAHNPADLGAWRQARREYRNLLVIEKAANAKSSVDGLLTPESLSTAVKSMSARDYSRGRGDFAELAKAASDIMKSLPNSGTAGRLRGQGVQSAILASLFGGGGAAAGGIPGAIAGAALGAAVPTISGNIRMSPIVQQYLRNQLMAGVPLGGSASRNALMGGAMPLITSR